MTAHCGACGASYTDAYARVFGDNNDELHACQRCADSGMAELGYGAAAGLDTDKRKASRGGAY